MIIYFSGAMGSGKSTLKNLLCDYKGFAGVGESELGLSYLPKIFNDPIKWIFEGQLAFLLEKHARLTSREINNEVVLVDRSFEEDYKIFFIHFFEKYNLQMSTLELYNSIYNLVIKDLKLPSITIFLKNSLESSIERSLKRTGQYNDYDETYIKEVYERYEVFYTKKHNFYELNTEVFDFREQHILNSIFDDIEIIIHSTRSNTPLKNMNILRYVNKPT